MKLIEHEKDVVVDDVINKIIQYNAKDKNILKVAEECAELGEVMIKMVTKQPEDKPPMEKVTEEMGDVLFRCFVVMRQLNIEQEVMERIIAKAEQVDSWISKHYEGIV